MKGFTSIFHDLCVDLMIGQAVASGLSVSAFVTKKNIFCCSLHLSVK